MADVRSAFEAGVGPGGLAWVKVKHPSGSTCTVHLFGATVTSVTSAAGRELLFTSKASAWDGSGPIRGGIPVVFPQFGTAALPGIAPGKTLPMHGFARRFAWRAVAQTVRAADGACLLTLELTPADLVGAEGADVREAWPYDFALSYTLTLGAGGGPAAGAPPLFAASLEVRNTGGGAASTPGAAEAAVRRAEQVARALGGAPSVSSSLSSSSSAWECQALLHTYFSVSDIHAVALRGFGGAPLLDKLALAGGATPALRVEDAPDDAAGRRIERETDQIYPALAPEKLVLICSDGDAQAVAVGRGCSAGVSPDCVLWNPWVDKSRAMGDFDDDGYKTMVCVEPGFGLMPGSAVRLFPGQAVSLQTTIDLVDVDVDVVAV
jgi:glucose-6-phosphate 1-epimerase